MSGLLQFFLIGAALTTGLCVPVAWCFLVQGVMRSGYEHDCAYSCLHLHGRMSAPLSTAAFGAALVFRWL